MCLCKFLFQCLQSDNTLVRAALRCISSSFSIAGMQFARTDSFFKSWKWTDPWYHIFYTILCLFFPLLYEQKFTKRWGHCWCCPRINSCARRSKWMLACSKSHLKGLPVPLVFTLQCDSFCTLFLSVHSETTLIVVLCLSHIPLFCKSWFCE